MRVQQCYIKVSGATYVVVHSGGWYVVIDCGSLILIKLKEHHLNIILHKNTAVGECLVTNIALGFASYHFFHCRYVLNLSIQTYG